jgi:DNA-binding transcriptional MerR regulator
LFDGYFTVSSSKIRNPMPYKEKEIEKLYFTIGEVAQMFNVNTSHIRFWSKEFEVIRPATNKKGNRLYTQSDIENFRKIYHLVKEKGFTLKGAKSELKENKIKAKVATIATAPVQAEEGDVNLHDNPVEIPFPGVDGQELNGYVDMIAVKNSFQKMKASLLEIDRELSMLEN